MPGATAGRTRLVAATVVATSAFVTATPPLAAQELEPRSYAASPIGVRFVLTALGHSAGDVAVDPTAPLSDVRSKAYSVLLGFGGTFALFGRTASMALAVPYGWMDVSGNVGEARQSVERSGLTDIRMRLAVNILGGPALTPREFATRPPSNTVVGASIAVGMPTGQYFSDKLVNLGTNRWAFKPEIGISHPRGPWALEFYAAGWFFTENSTYFGGHSKEQHSMLSLQSHVAYTFKPRLWLAGDATFYSGGRNVIDGVPSAVSQENTRIGLTLALPMLRTSAIKLAWSTGAIVRAGGDFTNYSIAWQTNFMRR
jgi:hypothetical protein